MAKKIKQKNGESLKEQGKKDTKKIGKSINLGKEKVKLDNILKKDVSNIESFKKHHVWGGIGIIIGIILTILVISIFSFKYINFIEQESYIKGSQEIAELIYKTIDENGGVILNIGGREITVAKYEKPVSVRETGK